MRRALLSLPVLAAVACAVSGCGMIQPPAALSLEKADPVTVCTPVDAHGLATIGTVSPEIRRDVEITNVTLLGATNLEVAGWYTAMPPNLIGTGNGFTPPGQVEHVLHPGEHGLLEIGVHLLDPTRNGHAASVRITYRSRTDTGTATAPHAYSLVAHQDGCATEP